VTEDTKIGFVAINAGLSCLPYLHDLREIVGAKRALDLVLTGRILTAEEAERIGLVTRVVSRNKLMDSALEIAADLAVKSPLAVTFTKQANISVRDMSSGDAANFLNEHFALLCASVDGQESLKARITGVKPEWKGK
jgi:enoyl-CoA hydratase/carnithine racemase